MELFGGLGAINFGVQGPVATAVVRALFLGAFGVDFRGHADPKPLILHGRGVKKQ